MKTVVFLAMVLASLSVVAPAQTRTINKSDVTTVTKLSFPREKFDPRRDPKLDLQNAVAKAARSGKRIIMDVGGEWCGWCVYMDRFFFENSRLAKLRDGNFVWIKINMSPENENRTFLSSYPEIKGYPHLFVLDETGKLLHSQDTSDLEAGKGYDLARFTEFLKTWSPAKKSDGR